MDIDRFVQLFMEGPGPGFCFFNGRWWRYLDGYWSRDGAGWELNQAIRTFSRALFREEGCHAR